MHTEDLADRNEMIYREDLPVERYMIGERKFSELKERLTADSRLSYVVRSNIYLVTMIAFDQTRLLLSSSHCTQKYWH